MIDQIRQMTHGVAVSVTSTPVKVLSIRNRRWEGLIQNTHASTKIKVGTETTVKAGNGIVVSAGEVYRHQGRGELWAAAASGTVSVGTTEIIGPGNMRTHVREYTQTVTSDRAILLTKNFARMHAVVENTDSTNPITIGTGRIYANAGGIVLKAGEQLSLFGGMEVWAVAGGTNEVQTLTIGGSPTGGSYTLQFGIETAEIPYNADAAAIQAALESLQPIGAGNVAVAGTGPFTVTFQNELGARNVSQLVTDDTGLTGGTSPSASVATTTPGAANSVVVAVIEESRR